MRKIVLGDSDMGETVRPGWTARVRARVRELLRRVFGRLHPVELLAAALAVLVALCSCHDGGPQEPDRSDPFEPPAPVHKGRSRVVGAAVLDDGSILVLMAKPSG